MDSLPEILQQSNTNRIYTPTTHVTISTMTLPPKTRKLVITLTTTILTHIWKTRNRLQFDDTIIPTTHTIINIKNELKHIIQTLQTTHY